VFGLELLAAAMLHLPQNTAQNGAVVPVVAQMQCRVTVSPKINVLPSKSRVRYDFTKSKSQLNNVDVDTISPYGPNHKTNVSGLMSGSIQVKHQVSFMHETYGQLGQGCLYLKAIDVKIHIDPTVYIANEYPNGSCMHTAVLTHERKHVREDQLIVNKYSNYIGRALLSLVDSQGPAFGSYDTARLPFVQQNIQNSVTKVIKKFNDQMNQERQRRQQAIDNLEEYESIGIRCPKKRRR
jgi:hypothetical protein